MLIIEVLLGKEFVFVCQSSFECISSFEMMIFRLNKIWKFFGTRENAKKK